MVINSYKQPILYHLGASIKLMIWGTHILGNHYLEMGSSMIIHESESPMDPMPTI